MSWFFAQWYGLISRSESAAMRKTRSRLVSGLTGDVLEVGVGNGLNLPHYDERARVTGIDYNRHMLAKAAARARAARAEVALEVADVQALPFPDDRFDHAVAGLVFCSVADAERGLRELLRVTKPGGSVRLLEHVRAAPGRTRRARSPIGFRAVNLKPPRRKPRGVSGLRPLSISVPSSPGALRPPARGRSPAAGAPHPSRRRPPGP